jgi:hypothetical protein
MSKHTRLWSSVVQIARFAKRTVGEATTLQFLFDIFGVSFRRVPKGMSKKIVTYGVALISLTFVIAAVCKAQVTDRNNYVEVAPGTKLCDLAEDVYGFYLVKSEMRLNGTQEAEYFRFGAQIDPQTGAQEHILQRSFSVWFKRHPQYKDKLKVIDAVTGEADEFPYAVCKK